MTQASKPKRSGSSRPELNKAQWQRIRRAVRQRDGNSCRNCGASGPGVRLGVHHLTPAKLGGTDDVANLATLCSGCHAIYEQAARTLTLPVDTPGARVNGNRTRRRRNDRHPAPFRGPTGQPWSREWFDY
jgi:5-methylcytosine-specific restriction endonuclease McrA